MINTVRFRYDNNLTTPNTEGHVECPSCFDPCSPKCLGHAALQVRLDKDANSQINYNQFEAFYTQYYSMASTGVVKRRLPWNVKPQILEIAAKTPGKRGVSTASHGAEPARRARKRGRNVPDVKEVAPVLCGVPSEAGPKRLAARKGLHPIGVPPASRLRQQQSPARLFDENTDLHHVYESASPCIASSTSPTGQVRARVSGDISSPPPAGTHSSAPVSSKKWRRGVVGQIRMFNTHEGGAMGKTAKALPRTPPAASTQGSKASAQPAARPAKAPGGFQMHFRDESDSDTGLEGVACSSSALPPASRGVAGGATAHSPALTPKVGSKRVSLLSLLHPAAPVATSSSPSRPAKPSLLARLGIQSASCGDGGEGGSD